MTNQPNFNLTLETRLGDWGGEEFRILDNDRKIRTPWQVVRQHFLAHKNSLAAAKMAVRQTNREKLMRHKHSLDGEWVVVFSL